MNLANKLTLIRIFMVPIFMMFLLHQIQYGQHIATFIFILAAITDSLDGYIARKRNQITNFGKFMDPLADKLLVSAALISLVSMGKISPWFVVIIISREYTISVLRAVAASEGIVIAASVWGKFKTIFQIIAIIFLLMEGILIQYIDFLPISIVDFSVYLAVIFTIISGVDYLRLNKDILK